MSNITKKDNKSLFIIAGIIATVGISLFTYLIYFVSPEEVEERVRIIAVTESGCIAETMDGFSVNIGFCDAKPGDMITAMVDQKVKDRAMAMNPTS